MKAPRRSRRLIAGAILLAFVVAAAVGAFRSDASTQGVALCVLGGVIIVITLRTPAEPATDPRRSMLVGALVSAVIGVSMFLIAFTDDDPVGRVLAATAGGLSSLAAVMFALALWKLKRRDVDRPADGD